MNTNPDCSHIGCTREATQISRNRDYCESHAELRNEIDATRSQPSPQTEAHSPRTETGEGLKGVSWQDYWALKAHAERLAEALSEIATCSLEDEPDAAVLIATARTALAQWEGAKQ